MKLPISKLVNNTGQIDGVPANPRQINKDDYQKLITSLQEDSEFMEHKPLHVYEQNGKYIVLGGNMRLRALRELGWKEVPVTIYKPETPADVLRRRVIVDNSNYGSYDMDAMANEWSEEPLDDWGVDLPDDWLKDEEDIVEDEAPEVDEKEPAKSKRGEVYQLGEHRVMCGDSTDEADVAKLMDGVIINCVHTDPPYGVDYQSKKLGGILNDKLSKDSLYQFVRDAFTAIKNNLADDAGVYCWYEDKFRHTFQQALEDSGYEYKQNLIWNKGMNLSGADYQKAHENVLYLQVAGGKASWYGGRDKKTNSNCKKKRYDGDE